MTIKTKSASASPERERRLAAAKNEIAAFMKGKCDELGLTADEVLAMTAFMTGVAIANQDQRRMTPTMAIELVQQNIEAGNAAAMQELLSAGGPAQ